MAGFQGCAGTRPLVNFSKGLSEHQQTALSFTTILKALEMYRQAPQHVDTTTRFGTFEIFISEPLRAGTSRAPVSHLTPLSRMARHRLMKRNCLYLASVLAISLISFSSLAGNQPLPRSTPEGQGIS